MITDTSPKGQLLYILTHGRSFDCEAFPCSKCIFHEFALDSLGCCSLIEINTDERITILSSPLIRKMIIKKIKDLYNEEAANFLILKYFIES